MSDTRLRRSVLFVPGSNQRALDKARTLPADALIFDLEDAVAAGEKERAREQVVRAVKAGGYGSRELVIGVNALQTPWGEGDLAAVVEARPDAILMPKVSSRTEAQHIGDQLEAFNAPPGLSVWAMIETPLAILNMMEIARARRDRRTRLSCLVLGANDLARETRASIHAGRASMLPWMMWALAAARVEGLEILDSVWNDIGDTEGCREECRQAHDFGFDGKTLIHPNQIEPANSAFTPSAEEVRRARMVIDAFAGAANAQHAAMKLEGRMYQRGDVAPMQRLVARAKAIAAREAESCR